MREIAIFSTVDPPLICYCDAGGATNYIRDDAAATHRQGWQQLHEVLLDATEEAQRHNVLGAVFIEATNGSVTTMVVGGRDGPWL